MPFFSTLRNRLISVVFASQKVVERHFWAQVRVSTTSRMETGAALNVFFCVELDCLRVLAKFLQLPFFSIFSCFWLFTLAFLLYIWFSCIPTAGSKLTNCTGRDFWGKIKHTFSPNFAIYGAKHQFGETPNGIFRIPTRILRKREAIEYCLSGHCKIGSKTLTMELDSDERLLTRNNSWRIARTYIH